MLAASLLPEWLTLQLLLGVAVVGLLLVFIALWVSAVPPNTRWLEGEARFLTPSPSETIPIPSLSPKTEKDGAKGGELDLSVVVPAYKETKRLPPMLDSAIAYLASSGLKWEIVVVDDGSNDGTSECALEYSKKHGTDHVRVVKLLRNRGKGGAVRMGVLSSRGALVLMADADAATQFSDFKALQLKLAPIIKDGHGLAVGSRAHLEEESIASRSLFRTILMIGFHVLVSVCCGTLVKDTQCGFKLFTRKTALTLFTTMHIDRWAFDVELLYVAQRLCIPIVEVAVNWQEIEGSKLDPLWSSLQMARDLVRIRVKYLLGLWSVDKTYF